MKRTTLTDQQIREIPRLRSAGKQFKVICRAVGCTIGQARHHWRKFQDAAYGEKNRRRTRHNNHINRGLKAIQTGRRLFAERTEDEQRIIAQRALAAEIAAAKAEAANAQPFKIGNLTW